MDASLPYTNAGTSQAPRFDAFDDELEHPCFDDFFYARMELLQPSLVQRNGLSFF
ncbi:hypothetical protein TIFTF001_002145 [Ficus carica]|uniref:Uncharacterized protein n=1 Tax=Ficus carica TaxID=3494 RepID=A0AA87ZSD6_FICCA|nr:hypothetical protein TIFTF001_002145 [Ficus carica]